MAYKYTKAIEPSKEVSNTKTIEVDNSDAFILIGEWDSDSITANKFKSCNGL